MQLQQTLLVPTLAVLLISLALSTALPVSGKKSTCCTQVSTGEVKNPILSFAFQPENLPCVNAFVVETAKGTICCAPKQPWVRKTIKALMKLQQAAAKENKTEATTGSPLASTLL